MPENAILKDEIPAYAERKPRDIDHISGNIVFA